MAIIAGLGEDVIRRRISFPAVSRISRDSGPSLETGQESPSAKEGDLILAFKHLRWLRGSVGHRRPQCDANLQ